MLLSILIGGCGWENTRATARSAYVKTQRAVTNTLLTIGKYQRDHAYGQQRNEKTDTKSDKNTENKKVLTASPNEMPNPDDRFPSKTHLAREENLNHGESRKSARAIKRDETSKEMPLPPRTAMTLEELRQRIRDIERERVRSKNLAERRRLATELKELERTLLTYQKEENIIGEMTQLRLRLRKLQEELLEIQQPNR